MGNEEQNLAFIVQQGDRDRFLAAQLAPFAKRDALYAVTALQLELARVAETVSEPLIGHIRLAWWREALEEIMADARPRNHPVVLALHALHANHAVIFPWLLKLVESRAADLDESMIADEAAWLAYLDGTAGALHMSWALLLDAEKATMLETKILADARAYAMVGLARAIPYMAQQGFVRFAPEHIAEHQLSALTPSLELAAFVNGLMHKVTAQLRGGRYPRALLPMGGLVSLLKQHLQSIRKAEYDPYKIITPRLAIVLRIIQMKFFLC